MTTIQTTVTDTVTRYPLPDPPENHLDRMTSTKQLIDAGSGHYLKAYLGNPETTIVTGERYLQLLPNTTPQPDMTAHRYPDLLVAFNVDVATFERNNGYVIADHGKPPDFILEVASANTHHIDTGAKRREYEALGVREYWRFDENGEFLGTKLAGDRLINGKYEPIEIEELPDGNLRAYSAVLNLYVQWQNHQLVWCDPITGNRIPTLASERQARIAAEARVAELEAQLRAQQS